MKKIFLLSAIIVSLYANDDYVSVSKMSDDKQVKYNFIKVNNPIIDDKKQILKNDLILKNETKSNTTILTKEIEPLIENRNLKLNVSLSDFNSISDQYIYNTNNGRKISQLTWEADNVTLLGLGLAYNIKDTNIYLNYKTKLTNSDGMMDDYDWVSDQAPDIWTHWSHHDNTRVEEINIIDLGINKEFSIYNKTKLIMSLGYKWEKQLFKAYDGSYVYSGSSASEFRAYTGTFDGLGITYEQVYKGFYLGAELQRTYKEYNFLLNVKYTPKMNVEFTDTHHKRSPSFTDYTSFDDTSMLALGVGIDYTIDKNQMLSLFYDYTKYSYIRGDRVRSYITGYNLNLPNTVGVESKNNILTLKYMYTF